jgi:hypothetical protein
MGFESSSFCSYMCSESTEGFTHAFFTCLFMKNEMRERLKKELIVKRARKKVLVLDSQKLLMAALEELLKTVRKHLRGAEAEELRKACVKAKRVVKAHKNPPIYDI